MFGQVEIKFIYVCYIIQKCRFYKQNAIFDFQGFMHQKSCDNFD